jgi:hypothetical protein
MTDTRCRSEWGELTRDKQDALRNLVSKVCPQVLADIAFEVYGNQVAFLIDRLVERIANEASEILKIKEGKINDLPGLFVTKL